MSRGRHTAIVFRTTVGPSFARCCGSSCGATLAGLRCWTWIDGDGARRYGCRLCLFRDARIAPRSEAA